MRYMNDRYNWMVTPANKDTKFAFGSSYTYVSELSNNIIENNKLNTLRFSEGYELSKFIFSLQASI
jgi:hypothetical protein